MLHVSTSFSCLHQLTQVDPYVPMTVLLDCSPVITGRDLLHLSLQESFAWVKLFGAFLVSHTIGGTREFCRKDL